MTIGLVILAVLLVFYFTFSVINTYSEVTYVKSDVDNRKYMIRRGSKPEGFLKESANTLAEINNRIVKLIDHLHDKYSQDPSKNYWISMLKTNYNYNILSEAAVDSRYTTFTVDKSEMHVCLRTRDQNEKMYDINLLMYVILHELAHLCNFDRNQNPIHGHGAEFKRIFKFLVVEAIRIGIYNYTDYNKQPNEYCGILINSHIVDRHHLDMYLKVT
jgi:hypothetical protein